MISSIFKILLKPIFHQVLVKKTDCDVESELAEHYNSHPSPSEDRNSQVYIGEATDQKSLEKLETNKDDRTSNEDTSTLCASSVECDPEHSEMIKSEVRFVSLSIFLIDRNLLNTETYMTTDVSINLKAFLFSGQFGWQYLPVHECLVV